MPTSPVFVRASKKAKHKKKNELPNMLKQEKQSKNYEYDDKRRKQQKNTA